MHNLKSACPKNLNIGIAIKIGDCFFDSVAQGLNELNIKPDHYFTAKSLRKDCADYVEQHGKQDSWAYKAVIKDAAIGGYLYALEGPYGPIQDPKTKINMIDKEKTFNKYLKDIKNMATETNSLPICGRLDIEGRMICEKYKVKIEVIALEREPIDDKYTTTGEQGEDDDVVRIVNYRDHFVPLLSGISENITESQQVSSEEIFSTDKRVPTSDQSEKEVQQEIINISTSVPVYTNKGIPASHRQEQKTQQKEYKKINQ